MATTDKKNCFIIMPITTPDDWIPRYRNDSIHFHHVLNHLFLPAIELADFNPIKPIAEGADNIPAEIIKNLDEADLVLCDLSIFNPNVFFELGIRTALDKPICMVKDEYAPRIPFDVSIINCHQYKSTLDHWDMKSEIEILSKHLKSSLNRSDSRNPLWKYFGIRIIAKSPEGGNNNDKLDLLLLKMDELANNTSESHNKGKVFTRVDLKDALTKLVHDYLNVFLPELECNFGINFNDATIIIFVNKLPVKSIRNEISYHLQDRIKAVFDVNFKIIFEKENRSVE